MHSVGYQPHLNDNASTVHRIPPYRRGMYRGLSYSDASRAMIEICRVAADTGQTLAAVDHLGELASVLRCYRF